MIPLYITLLLAIISLSYLAVKRFHFNNIQSIIITLQHKSNYYNKTDSRKLQENMKQYDNDNIFFNDNVHLNSSCISYYYEPYHLILPEPMKIDPIYKIDAIYVVHWTVLVKRKEHIIKMVKEFFDITPTFIEAFDKKDLTQGI